MGNELYTKFLDMQKKGKHVKVWWFNSKTRDLVKEKYPAKHPPLNHRWFQGFSRRYKISLRRQTHAAQKSAAAIHTAIEKFHAELYKDTKEEFSQLRIWATWTKRCCFLLFFYCEPMKRLVLMKFG